MTHPPSGPNTPSPPSGPREPVQPLDPDSPKGREVAAAMSQVLAEIQVAIWRRSSSARTQSAA